MAKKHHKKTTHRRRSHRRGIGAVNTSSVMTKIVGVAIGAVGGRMLNNALGSKVDPKIAAGATILIGAIAPSKMAKGSALVGGIGDGLVAVGVTNLLSNLGVIKGVDDFADGMSGVGDLSEIGNYETGVAGYEETEP